MVLNAHRLGDCFFCFHREVWLRFGPSGPPSYLPQQRHNFCTLIKVFGPNQLVLVANPSNPISPAGTDFCSPQTLHGCLELTYVVSMLTITGYRKAVARNWRDLTSQAPSSVWLRSGPKRQSATTNCGSGSSTPLISTHPRISTGVICSAGGRIANVSKGRVIRGPSHNKAGHMTAQPSLNVVRLQREISLFLPQRHNFKGGRGREGGIKGQIQRGYVHLPHRQRFKDETTADTRHFRWGHF